MYHYHVLFKLVLYFALVERDMIVQFLVLCDWFIPFCAIVKSQRVFYDKYILMSAYSVPISPGNPTWFMCLWCRGRMLSTNVYWAICYLVIRLSRPRKKLCLQNIIKAHTWWRHQMETFSALLALCAGNSPVTAEFPSQRPVKRSFDVFFDLCLNKRLSKQSWCWWFETPIFPIMTSL